MTDEIPLSRPQHLPAGEQAGPCPRCGGGLGMAFAYDVLSDGAYIIAFDCPNCGDTALVFDYRNGRWQRRAGP